MYYIILNTFQKYPIIIFFILQALKGKWNNDRLLKYHSTYQSNFSNKVINLQLH